MKRFATLYAELDRTGKTNEKVAALVRYFSEAPAADAAWAVYFLLGNKVSRVGSGAQLRVWCSELSGCPLWLVEECYDVVGDLAETLALLVRQDRPSRDLSLSVLVEKHLLPLRAIPEEERARLLKEIWRTMDDTERFVWNKLLTGSLRVGVSHTLAARALAEVSGIERSEMAHRLVGEWTPSADAYRQVMDPHSVRPGVARPYPFFLAHPLDQEPERLGPIDGWLLEWKWDGIRMQALSRAGEVLLWSRGEEAVTDQFPEIRDAVARLPAGTVLDGEALAWRDGRPLPFSQLQRRLGRKQVSASLRAEVPVALIAYDLLEENGEDLRQQPLTVRRARLEALVEHFEDDALLVSPRIECADWEELCERRAGAREAWVEGVMLKQRSSSYGVGRVKGPWWKWKIDPYTLDAVLVYAQKGKGRRAGLFTDYTFSVWHEGALTPIAKAYSGLSDSEIAEVDRFIKAHTLDRFGPVRTVKPELVFELAFEGIRESRRHKSGLALRFPRIARWRRDKRPDQADTLELARALLSNGERDDVC